MLPFSSDDIGGLADANAYFFGELIGEGDHRRVYAVKGTNDYVFKVAKPRSIWANFAEYDFWDAMKNTALEKYIAPCQSISPGGRILCMRRAARLARPCEVPKMLPRCFSDTHRGNIGILDGKAVVIDYGIHAARFHGIDPKKMYKTHAWEMAQQKLAKARKDKGNARLPMSAIEWDV